MCKNLNGCALKLALALLSLFAISTSSPAQKMTSSEVHMGIANPEAFAAYWLSGEAEVNRYSLQIASGDGSYSTEARLTYFIEKVPLHRHSDTSQAPADSVPALRMHGLWPAAADSSSPTTSTGVDTPIDFRRHPFTLYAAYRHQHLKDSSHAALQLREGGLHFMRKSFSPEGLDEHVEKKPMSYTEEDLWTRMRLETQMLPLGQIDILPSLGHWSRSGNSLMAHKARAILLIEVGDQQSNAEHYIYRLEYLDIDRRLEWRCTSTFPYTLLEYREDAPFGKNDPGKLHMTLRDQSKQPLEEVHKELPEWLRPLE